MSICPYCGSEYRGSHPPIALSRRQRDVYNNVVASGPRGITAKSLLSAIYGDNPPKSAWGVIRVNVFEINRKIKNRGERIKGRRDLGYVLIRDDVTDGE